MHTSVVEGFLREFVWKVWCVDQTNILLFSLTVLLRLYQSVVMKDDME